MGAKDLSQRFSYVIPRSMHRYRDEIRSAARSEFTVLQFRVLAYLSRMQTASNAELAEYLGTTPPMMSRIVDVLVDRGVVLRGAGTRDRRKISLKLSSLGKRKFSMIQGMTRARFSAHFQSLTVSQRNDLDRGLRVLEEIFGS